MNQSHPHPSTLEQTLKNINVFLARGKDLYARRHTQNHPLKILLVEDDFSTRQLLHSLLTKEPVTLRFAVSAEEAARIYASWAPHILFLDTLPDISGHKLLEAIHAADPAAHVIMLTANANRQTANHALKHENRRYLPKPFTHGKLKEILQQYRTRHSAPA